MTYDNCWSIQLLEYDFIHSIFGLIAQSSIRYFITGKLFLIEQAFNKHISEGTPPLSTIFLTEINFLYLHISSSLDLFILIWEIS